MNGHEPQRPLTSMIGRQQELTALGNLLGDPEVRLVSIIGAGGIGKTRLAIELAERVRDDFSDGVAFADLAPLRDASFLAERILYAIGAEAPDGVPADQALLAACAQQQRLIILDNVEHLLDGSPLIQSLLEQAPEVVILATSRERLGLSAERSYELKPLSIPDQHGEQSIDAVIRSESVQLFLQRAQAADRTFTLSDESAADIAAICRRLDGLPLAIELAAARVADIPPHLILRNFVRILPFLERSSLDPEGRHRTMTNAIAWSYERLAESERALFARLSVFVGKFTIAAARAMSPDKQAGATDEMDDVELLRQLGSLVSKQLLIRADWHGDAPSCSMLEMLREFGRGELVARGEYVSSRNAHARYFLAFAEDFHAHMRDPEPGKWLDLIESEIDELRAAHEWLLAQHAQDSEDALKLVNRLDYFWSWRGHTPEGMRRILDSLALPGEEESFERGRAYLILGNLTENDFHKSRDYYEKSLKIMRGIDRNIEVAGLLANLGMTALYLNNLTESASLLLEAQTLFVELDFPNGAAQCSYHLGGLAARRKDYPGAIEQFDRAHAVFEEIGDAAAAHFCILEIGRVYRLAHRYQEAQDMLGWGLARFRAASIGQGIRMALGELGWVSIALNQSPDAITAFREAVSLSLATMRCDEHLLLALDGIAQLAHLSGHFERSVEILGSNNRWLTAAGMHRLPEVEEAATKILDACQRRLDPESFQVALHRGELRSIEETSRYALEFELDATPLKIASTPAAKPADFGLTNQEMNVLCRVADGATNRQVAEALFISERTVAVHVASVLRKLDAENRTRASSIAFSHHLCLATD